MTTILKANSGADFLAMLPQLVGCDISDSVVFVGFRGKRTCAAIRFDLPPASASKAVLKKFTTAAMGTLGKIQALESVVVVIATSELFGARAEPPYGSFAQLLVERIERSGWGSRDAICQAADGWASYFDPSVPVGGHSLYEIELSSIPDQIPDCDKRPIRDRRGADRIPDAAPEESERVATEMTRLRSLLDDVLEADSDELPDDLEPFGDIPAFIDGALEWDERERQKCGPLFLCIVQGPPMRDHTMLQWASDLETGHLLFLWATAGPAGTAPLADERFGGLMMGIGPRPDVERIEKGIQLLLALTPSVHGRDRLAPLCMLAWLNWALGRGSTAGRYLDEAITIDRRYGMVEVLATILHNGMLPNWAFDE